MLLLAQGRVVVGLMVLGLMLLFVTVVGAIILRIAASLYNSMFGGKRKSTRVPVPEFGQAMAITLGTTIVNFGVGLVIGFVFGFGGAAAGLQARAMSVPAQLVSIPVSFLVLSAMLSSMLPTTFGKAMVVAVLQLVVTVLIIFGLVIVLAGITGL